MPSSSKGPYANMDLVRASHESSSVRRHTCLPCAQVGIVSTLESHWVVLDAELSEIRKDYAALRTVRPCCSLEPCIANAQWLRCRGSSRANTENFGTDR